ncbi:MAG TPA: ATP-binding protein [Candidatus Saccharimonadales bacterium]|jgi:predicted ATPase|nr:ATP-binding protein [Candidatus Saccharimonadales bacterium]
MTTPAKNNWFVITGGPASGKTTLLAELHKKGHQIIPEAARWVVDRGMAKGLSVTEIRQDEARFQDVVLRRKLAVEARLDPAKRFFFDRGMHDTLAYLQAYDYELSRQTLQALKQSRYAKVFLLEPLPVFVKDYSRVESDEFPERIYHLLYEAYASYGMEPVLVPDLGIKKRVQFVLQNLD